MAEMICHDPVTKEVFHLCDYRGDEPITFEQSDEVEDCDDYEWDGCCPEGEFSWEHCCEDAP